MSETDDSNTTKKLPREGDVVAGKYRIDKVIGVGGMGCVVAAQHLLLNQKVAIKFVLPEGANSQQYTARFFREAQTAAAIKSEHVVRVVDMGTLDNALPYMVMEFLDGIDLAALVDRDGPLPIEEAVNYTLQACEALAEAHAAGLTHRDIKSSNLFLTHRSDGSPLIKLLDFGIAKAQTVLDGQLTATGTVMGSPHYMSPEQVRDAKTVDARSDIWSLGATLHELLTGHPPFSGTTFSALCAAIVADAPARLTELRRNAPLGLEQVILRCLEKDAGKRYEDVGALAQALLAFAGPHAELSVERIVRIARGQSQPERRSEQPSLPRVSVAPKAEPAASPFDATAASSSAVIGIAAPSKSQTPSKRNLLLAGGLAAAAVFALLLLVVYPRTTLTLDNDAGAGTAGSPSRPSLDARPAPSASALPEVLEPAQPAASNSAAALQASAEAPKPSASVVVVPWSPVSASLPPVPPVPPTPPSIKVSAPAPPVPSTAAPKSSAKPKGSTTHVDPFANQH